MNAPIVIKPCKMVVPENFPPSSTFWCIVSSSRDGFGQSMLTNCFFGCFVGVLLLVTAMVTQESDTIVAAKSKKGRNLVTKEAGQKNNSVGSCFIGSYHREWPKKSSILGANSNTLQL